MSRPIHCPRCGSPFHVRERPDWVVSIQNATTGAGGYDCYFGICGWSGDIHPDAEDPDYESRSRQEILNRRA